MSEPDVRDDSQPDQLDIRIGDRLKALRTQAQVTQKTLGDACGVTFQQIQKYERGISRIPASNLIRLAEVLKVEITAFFEGEASENYVLVLDPTEHRLMDAFKALKSEDHRQMALRFLEDMSRTLPKKS